MDPLTEDQVVDRIFSGSGSTGCQQIITANALMIMAAQSTPALAETFGAAQWVVPDSAGVVWALRRRGQPAKKVAGIDLMERLCRESASRGSSVYLLGAGPGVASRAAERLKEKYPGLRVAGAEDGYFSPAEEAGVIDRVAQAAPDFLFVALSMPRQDVWIHAHVKLLGAKWVMGVGGSFDVLSGRLKRSPRWMQRWGLEWFFRLCQEPRRLARMGAIPKFIWRVMTERDKILSNQDIS